MTQVLFPKNTPIPTGNGNLLPVMVPADLGAMCRADFHSQFNLAMETDELILGRDNDFRGVVEVVAVGGYLSLLLHRQLFRHTSGTDFQYLGLSTCCLLLHNSLSINNYSHERIFTSRKQINAF